MVTKDDVVAAQAAWGAGVVAIGTAFSNGEDYRAVAERHVDDLYAYGDGEVLFKPTKVRDAPFRLTRDAAVSYFVAGDDRWPEDGGFALQPWIDVEFHNAGMVLEEDRAIAMGQYVFTPKEGDPVTVEYTFGYVTDGDGLRIDVHHSSLPFAG